MPASVALLAAGALAFALSGERAGPRALPDADGSTLAWRTDPGGRETPEEAMGRPAEDWRPASGDGYLRAPHGDALWLRVTLRNPGPEPLRGVLQDTEYYVDRVDAWIPSGTKASVSPDPGECRVLRSGESVPVNERPLRAMTPAFPVEVPAHGSLTVHVRETDHYFPNSRWRWWPDAEVFAGARLIDTAALCLALGALLALTLYNLVLWLRLRFPDTGCYVAYAASMTVFNFAAAGGLALTGDTIPASWKVVVETGALLLSGIFVVQFARHFLATAERTPRTDRWLGRLRVALLVLLAGAAAMPLMPGVGWLVASVAAVAATHAILLTVAVVAMRSGTASARFFAVAFGALFVCVLPACVARLGGTLSAGPPAGLHAGSVLEMLLLSFAVADRFARAQRRLLEETEQRRILEEAYSDELENEVRERTRELGRANADKDRMLVVIGHDLRGPLTGLMRSAGETEGAFAGEVSRTARELLLTLEDLALWARLRAGKRLIAGHALESLVFPAVALHRTLAGHGGVALVVKIPDGLRVETDLVLAQTLVRNLLANALKFAETRVVLRAVAEEDGGVRFTVGNDGPSLAPAVLARLTAGEDGPVTATGGLGLRLCREICRELGMRLDARSGPDGGAEFGFTLRTAKTSGAGRAPAAPSSRTPSPFSKKPGPEGNPS